MQVALDDYVWAAGVATDLVNTAPEVWHGEDKLPDLASLVAFAEQHSIPVSTRPGDLRAVHRLRTTVRDLIDHPTQDRLITGATELTATAAYVTLQAGAGRARWAVSLQPTATTSDALSLISGVGILSVVQTLGAERFHTCSAPTCQGAFIDTTRPGRRRYCMPGLCGNRVNVANHRANLQQRGT
ncbi:CGNR zinc finger domain-containing protein [Amycolatopsis sp. EV170708-02-1]|uniref:CGNR zinc finger domain-containing protein n=1 Tax=Amycolatopsis sp. EV170708-02-1 TaxID=2919322 RepID=UPI001F0BC70F|nr:CGNR zinc finger domain-containing protein [Amycolatopsis sp. EV170708-02-1]UMP05333.1 CGNR zinc finger domain-containing protein [Amycolatopsis sp. EV170708-02-1]